MCKWKKYGDTRIDPCMKGCINTLNYLCCGVQLKVVACCCGHGKYPTTIVISNPRGFFELISNVDIPRKKRFYKRDKEGYYYIPEILK